MIPTYCHIQSIECHPPLATLVALDINKILYNYLIFLFIILKQLEDIELTRFGLFLNQSQSLVALAWVSRPYGSLKASKGSLPPPLLSAKPILSLPPSLSRPQLWSICRAQRADGFSQSPLGLPGVGQYGAPRRSSKVKPLLLLPSLLVGYHERSRAQMQKCQIEF